MVNYPATFPVEAAQILVSRLRGEAVPQDVLLLAAWNVAGFALANAVGPGGVKSFRDEDLAGWLEEAAQDSAQGEMKSGAIPWGRIAAALLRLLVDVWLEEQPV